MTWLLVIVPNHGWLVVYLSSENCCCSLEQQATEFKSCCQDKIPASSELSCFSDTCGCGCLDVPKGVTIVATLAPKKSAKAGEQLLNSKIHSWPVDHEFTDHSPLLLGISLSEICFLACVDCFSTLRCARLCRWLI